MFKHTNYALSSKTASRLLFRRKIRERAICNSVGIITVVMVMSCTAL